MKSEAKMGTPVEAEPPVVPERKIVPPDAGDSGVVNGRSEALARNVTRLLRDEQERLDREEQERLKRLREKARLD